MSSPRFAFRHRWPLATMLVLALLALLSAAASPAALAQTGCVTISLDPQNATVQPNATFTVNVLATSPSQSFLGADFELQFDPNVLTVVTQAGVPATGVEQGNLGGIAPVNTVNNSSGRIRYAEVRTTGGEVTGNYTLATIRFKVVGAPGASSPLTFVKANAASPSIPTSILCGAPGVPAGGLVTIPAQPTFTPTPTRTPTQTPGAPPLCPNLLANSGFETDTAWQHPITPSRGDYTTADEFAGSRSMRLGIVPPGRDVYSYSTAYQQVTIPTNVTQARLVFYYKPFTEEAPWAASAMKDEDWSWYDPAKVIAGQANSKDEALQSMNAPAWAYQTDWQEALILDSAYRTKAVIFRSLSNSGEWQRVEYDVTRFKNQTINIYFNVLNNGTGGRRSWMYVDEVYLYGCTGPVPPTVTPTPTATPAPRTGCYDGILNGGFESNAVWQNPITPYRANYTTETAHTGTRAMRLGTAPPARDVYSHSSAYQSVVIPADAESARLTFWFRPYTEEPTALKVGEDWTDYQPARVIHGEGDARPAKADATDYQEALILDRNYNVLRTIFRTRSDFGQWAQMTVDVTAYKGRRIVPYFNAFNDGDGQRTWMFVDDVSLEICWPGSGAAATVSGQVTLQGRDQYDESVVGIDEMPCDQTGPTGEFQCDLAQDEPNAARLTAVHAGYLRADKALGAGSTDASTTELVAGDANGDCAIDIFDLVIVANAYDTNPLADARGDINGDGEINIYDLVLVASNYGLGCPTPWTAAAKTAAKEGTGSASVALRSLSKSKGIVWAEVTVKGDALYGADIRLSFDPSRLAPASAAGDLGAFFQDAHVVRNVVDAKAGTARFVATLLSPSAGASGSGVVYRVPFRMLGDGANDKRAPLVRLDKVQLVQKGGLPIMLEP